MKKLFLLLVVAGGAISSVPPLRAAAEPVMGPVLTTASETLDPLLSRILDPVFTWSARNESENLVRWLDEQRTFGVRLPLPTQFQDYVDFHYHSGRGGDDPWGSPYYLQITADSIVVGSPGPDAIPETPDDVTAAVER
ncbi:MAG: hypothetical protein ACREIV_11395 [Planctomycetaceae bacterium]